MPPICPSPRIPYAGTPCLTTTTGGRQAPWADAPARRLVRSCVRWLAGLLLTVLVGTQSACVSGAHDPPPWSCGAPYQTPTYSRPADDGVAFDTLIDAAGYAIASNSAWVDLSAGNFCGGPEKELVLIKNKHSNFSILGGPVPYAVGAGDLISSASHPWRAVAAADLDGGGYDEIVAVRRVTASGVPDLVVAKVNESNCEVSNVLATAILGNSNNSSWVDAAVGRFERSGTKQIVLLKGAHSNFFFVRFTPSGTLSIVTTSDLDSSSSHPWKAVAAGDLDQDGLDELIAARQASDGRGTTVLVYKWNGASFVRVATSSLGNTGNSDWASMAVGDFNGDGRQAIALVKNNHSNFFILDLPPGSAELRVLTSGDLDSATGQSWRGLVATDWVAGADQGAAELVAVRAATGAYHTDLFVYGNPFHRAARDSGLAGSKAQWDQNRDGSVEKQKEWLHGTHTNTIGWTLIEPGDYAKLVEFLEATRDFCVDGQQLRVTVTPDNPNPSPYVCALPQDSLLTPWNELDYFTYGPLGHFDSCSKEVEIPGPGPGPIIQLVKCEYCRDYLGWSSLIGRLAQHYPHLVAMGIDDFVYHINETFNGDYVAEMQSRLRSQAPWMSFMPGLYYHGRQSHFFGDDYPDFLKSVDTALFFFRNNKQGDGPCTGCFDHTGSGSCLDGVCAEATIPNAPGEFADMSALLPAGRKLQAGVYFARHSTLGEPSVRYGYNLVKLILSMPSLGGATVYAMQAEAVSCTETNFLSDKYCALRKAFGEGAISPPPTCTGEGIVCNSGAECCAGLACLPSGLGGLKTCQN